MPPVRAGTKIHQLTDCASRPGTAAFEDDRGGLQQFRTRARIIGRIRRKLGQGACPSSATKRANSAIGDRNGSMQKPFDHRRGVPALFGIVLDRSHPDTPAGNPRHVVHGRPFPAPSPSVPSPARKLAPPAADDCYPADCSPRPARGESARSPAGGRQTNRPKRSPRKSPSESLISCSARWTSTDRRPHRPECLVGRVESIVVLEQWTDLLAGTWSAERVNVDALLDRVNVEAILDRATLTPCWTGWT